MKETGPQRAWATARIEELHRVEPEPGGIPYTLRVWSMTSINTEYDSFT